MNDNHIIAVNSLLLETLDLGHPMHIIKSNTHHIFGYEMSFICLSVDTVELWSQSQVLNK